MKPGFFQRLMGGIVGKSSFAAAFVRGADLDMDVAGAGKLLEPYAQSAWVHRAIKLKVDEIARVPVKFYAGDNEFADPAFLAWWQTPFLTTGRRPMSLQDVREQLASWTDLAGEFFIVLGDDWLNPFRARNWKALSRPIIVKPVRMRHLVQGGQIVGWVLTDPSGQQIPLLPEQVIHRPLFNPYDDFRGLAPVRVVFNATESDYLAGLYVRNLMRNNGDQGVYVIAKNGVVGDEQREQIVAALREKRIRALRGDYAPAFLTGDISVEDPKAQSTDIDFNAGRTLNHHEIFVGLGVPPSMADVKASYSIGADSDRFTLITGTCMPLSSRIDAALSEIAGMMLGKPIVAEADWDDHPVIQHVRRDRIDGALKLWAAGMPLKDANSYLDLGMQPFLGWDRGYLPFSVAPVALDDEALPGKPANAPGMDPALDPEFDEDAGAGPDDDEAVKTLHLLVLARSRGRRMKCVKDNAEETRIEREFAQFACAHGSAPGVAQRADRPPRELAHWRTLMAARRTTLKSFQGAFGRVLMKARIQTLKNIEQYHPDAHKAAGIETKAAAANFLFDLANFTIDMKEALENQQKAGLKTAGQQLFDELGKDDIFSYPPAKVLEFLRARENKLRGVPQEVYDRLRKSLEEGLNEGESQAELSKRVRALFNDIADGDARTIAQTETGACYGAGRHQAMQQAGVQYKAWLTSGNLNIRKAHLQAGLDYPPDRGIPIEDPFIVDGEELDFPGDESGSPGNVINCHCVSIAVVPPDDKEGDS